MFWFIAWLITAVMLYASLSINYQTQSLNAEMIETIKSLQGDDAGKKENTK